MATIETILKERRIFPPSEEFTRAARVGSREQYDALADDARAGGDAFWAALAREHIDWIRDFTETYDGSNFPFNRWFADGQLNISANCLDRHLPTLAEETAIIFESDEGEATRTSYAELHAQVCQFANALIKLGVAKGDRVIIYMPMRTEAIVAIQACARIGAVHSVVFGGFSAKSLVDRIRDAGAKVIITANEGTRGGKIIPLKKTVDAALDNDCPSIERVVVLQCTDAEGITADRDIWWHDAIDGLPAECAPAVMGAEDPLFILYTSGSTGKPKGILHTVGGYLLGCILSMKWVFDYRRGDIYWCTADVGWVTGHSYVAYGPLAVGGTQVVFEGVPTYPHNGRFWEIVQKHRVTTFYTAPTAIRSLIKLGSDIPLQYDLNSLRLLGTVGEPINPEAWIWYYENVGGTRCPIVDTWWQTETGSNMIAPLPGAVPAKPGSCTLPLPGIEAAVVDEAGEDVPPGQGGFLVIKKPWPSQLRTIWGDDERYRETYYPKSVADGRYYVAGDSAHRDEDGYFWIMGRIDDVLNVSGHRLGTMEVESALVSHPQVAESAVIGTPDEVTGEAIVAFVVPKGDCPQGDGAAEFAAQLRDWVAQEIGAIAKPKDIRFGDVLPKTRSGKIMRRLLRVIAKGEEITQDTSTLENPGILEQWQKKA